ncbi:grasp-with-spasm system ATP-grasp peptide maturase [Chryseobacterium taichungense]|uniref:grasp-with-spasm system ATP-grasp peptide maturase n=1 Tax=Chryseobacterium taichungense TaxID=295069 RepID=UPI0028A7AB0F|nr:grasp-with-spasm system ATP-grasp peptide maturase [Chryseobacterium taichungense]
MEESDVSTNEVAEILKQYAQQYIIVLHSDAMSYREDYNGEFIIINEIEYDINLIKAVWFRRGLFRIRSESFGNSQLDMYIEENNIILSDYVNYKLMRIKSIGSPTSLNVNKLIVNKIAEECGLTIPEFMLSTNFENLSEIQYKKYITKGINGNTHIATTSQRIILPVAELESNVSGSLSLIQKYIEKKYELRIFYLAGKCWTMAIFSQNDDKTKIDYRNYNKEKPNRTIPYFLPENISSKLVTMMTKLNLNSGSIDMIVTPDDQFVFLEVNPVGQFGMVSKPCNYNLEYEIAAYLMK